MNRPNAWLVTSIAAIAFGAAFALTAVIPLALPQQQALDITAIPKLPTSVPADDAVSLAGLDVNLRRPLADTTATDPTVAPATCVLLGTSIDPTRPMAFVQLPDGTSRWLALHETTQDGYELTRVDRHSATIVQQGHALELSLPGATP